MHVYYPEAKPQRIGPRNADIHPSIQILGPFNPQNSCWCMFIYPLQEAEWGKSHSLSLRIFTNGKSHVRIRPHSQKHVVPHQHINKEDVTDKTSEKGNTLDFWLLYHVLCSVPSPEFPLTTQHADLLKQASGPDYDLAYLTKTLEQIQQKASEFTFS